jgi:hypothetical protein
VTLLLITSGCGDKPADAPRGTAIDTLPNGRRIVSNTAPTWSTRTAWRLEEDLRIGPASDGSAAFGDIRGLLVDTAGRIYAYDQRDKQVRVFLPSGKFSHAIGRLGKGPGELQSVTQMAMGPGDVLWIVDYFLGRYSAFDSHGQLLKTYARKLSGVYDGGQLGNLFIQGGRFLDWGSGNQRLQGKAHYAYRPILLDSTFTPQDSSSPQIDFPMPMTEGGAPQVFFVPDLMIYAGLDGTAWFGSGDEYKIHRRTLTGDTLLTFSLRAVPADITEADRRWIRDTLKSHPRYLSGLPKAKPLVHGLFGDNAGHVFVFVEESGVPLGTAIDVFEETGIYLGRLSLPHRVPFYKYRTATFAFATDEHIYLLGHSDTDVPFVSRLKILKAQ